VKFGMGCACQHTRWRSVGASGLCWQLAQTHVRPAHTVTQLALTTWTFATLQVGQHSIGAFQRAAATSMGNQMCAGRGILSCSAQLHRSRQPRVRPPAILCAYLEVNGPPERCSLGLLRPPQLVLPRPLLLLHPAKWASDAGATTQRPSTSPRCRSDACAMRAASPQPTQGYKRPVSTRRRCGRPSLPLLLYWCGWAPRPEQHRTTKGAKQDT
jgi:hypothetical protein